MAKKKQKTKKSRIIEEELTRLFSPEFLEKTARETGFIKRDRKINSVLMFWTLSVGFGVQLQRTLASLRRLYEKEGEIHISSSSFYDRFTPELVEFIHACVLHGLEDITQSPNRKLNDKLAGFEDIVTQDSTIIRLHEKLADKWPAARTRKVAAGVKISLLISAIADGPKKDSITWRAHQ